MGAYMEVVGRLEWVNSYGKKQCRSLFWRVKAALKKAVRKSRSKQQFKFQYDPSSYALNFDDGTCCHAPNAVIEPATATATATATFQDCSECKNTMWVYVLWVKS